MSYQYNPSAKEMRDAYSVAHGHNGDQILISAMFDRLTKEAREGIYATALERIAKEMETSS